MPNGLTIVVKSLPHLASVSVGLSVDIGSRDEQPHESGLSHLIEHMVFQGTRRRSTRELSRVISAVGGNLDACTGRESTAYYAKVPSRYFHLALDVLSDMLRAARFQPAKLKKEKQVILEEIRMYEDTPDEYAHDLFFQALWPKHPLGRSILGTRETLLNLKRPQVMDFLQRHYHPGRIILAVAGNIQPATVVQAARQYLGSMPLAKRSGTEAPPARWLGGRHLLRRRKLEQVHLCLGVGGLPYTHKQRWVALALSNIMGGGPNSRLFYEVREQRALVYTIYSFMDFYRDTGLAGLYLACHPRKARRAVRLVRDILYRLTTRPITDQELRDVREQMCGNYLISLETSSTHMWNMIQHEMYLHRHPKQKAILKSIMQITKSDILSLARSFFQRAPVASAIIGPVPNKLREDLQAWENEK